MSRFRLKDFSQQNLTRELTTNDRIFSLVFLLPVTIFFLWLWVQASLKFVDLYQEKASMHWIVIVGMILLTFITYFFSRITLKILGFGQQQRLISPYFYHPFVFYILSIAFMALVIFNFVQDGSYSGDDILDLLEMMGIGIFLFFMGFTVGKFWTK